MPGHGFERFEIDDPVWNDLPLPDGAREQWGGDPLERWRAARAIAGVLRREGVHQGAPYTAWCDGPTVFVSFLPGVGPGRPGQVTLEIEPIGRRFGVRARWSSPDPVWGPVPFDEFHRTVANLMVDRDGCDVDREAVLLALEHRGAHLAVPVTPDAGRVERLCGWLPTPQTIDTRGWDRHPRLEIAGFGYVAPLYHRPTECAFWHIVFQGRWSNAAHDEFVGSLRTLLPDRVAVRQIAFGCITADVLLAHGPGRQGLLRVDRRTSAAVGRACAVQWGPPMLPPPSAGIVAPPARAAQFAFNRMMQDLGDDENPRVDTVGVGPWAYLSSVDPAGEQLVAAVRHWPLGEDAATIRQFVERHQRD